MNIMSSKKRPLIRFLEFFVIGVVFGLGEDLIAIKVTTGVPITLEMVWITLLVALPFAMFTELVVDHPDFWRKLLPLKHFEGKKK